MPPAIEWFDVFQTPEFAVGLAAGLVLALVLYVLLRVARREPEAVAAFRNDSGQVLVSRRALREQIKVFCEDTPEVVHAAVKAKGRHDALSISIALKLRGDSHLTGISNELQEHTRTFLKNNLGIEKVGSIDILVSGIIPCHASAEKSSSLEPDDYRER